jgi:hypothetical protein
MNEQLPPIDARLREQLLRRSEGRLPDGLLQEVASGLDAVPTSRPSVSVSFGRPSRRTSGALVALATVVALLAALVAVPALRTGPAASGSYPTDRALTTAELAALMAGPALATNTALVADVTIQPNADVCPMDRYPTFGVVEGMPSQVCVMYQGLSSYRTTEPQSGIFAFRYLAPGVLGLVGEVTPASSRLSFSAADDWPLGGKTFVVDGWLGAVGLTVSCAYAPTAGDLLSPNGEDCPYDDWLGSESTAPGIVDDHVIKNGVEPSYDPLELRGNARHVQAGGMRIIDGLEPASSDGTTPPVHGEYVVRSATGACSGASPISSVGCPYWLVLAKLADITPPSTATPSPSLNPIPGYPLDRALTTAELSRVLTAPALATNTALVADVKIGVRADACSVAGYQTVGIVEDATSQICVVESPSAVRPSSVEPDGPSAFRYLAPGVLGLLGSIEPASSSRLAYSADGAWDGAGTTHLVEGWLSGLVHSCPALPSETPNSDVLNLNRNRCTWNRLSAIQRPPDWPSDPNDAAGLVSAENAAAIDGFDAWTSPVHGVWVVRDSIVLARLADIMLPSPTPSPGPPATPQAPTAYPTDRALTTAELGRLLDAGSLKQYDTVLVDAQVTSGEPGACQKPIWDLGFAGFIAGMNPQACVYAIPGVTIKPGHLLLRVLAGGTLGYMLTVRDGPSALAYGATDVWPQGSFVVHGWLDTDTRDCGKPAAEPSMIGYGLFSDGRVMCYAALTATAFDPTKVVYTGPTPAGPPRLQVGEWDLPADGRAVDPGSLFSMPNTNPVDGSIEGTYVVEANRHCSEYGDCLDFSVLARLADVTPPPAPVATPAPPATPTAAAPSSSTLAGYPADRPMTADELGGFLGTDGVKDRVVVAQVTLGKANCPAVGSYVPMGNVVGLESVCVVGIGDGAPEHSPSASTGTFAFRVLDAQTLGFMGNVQAASLGGLSFTSADAWPDGPTILVTGWLATQSGVRFCPAILVSDPLDPGAVDCGGAWIVGTPLAEPLSDTSTPPPSANPRPILVPAYTAADWAEASSGQATFLVRGQRVLAVVARVTLPAAEATPTPTPTPAPPASSVGLWGSGDRPLTVAELYDAYRANQLAGRSVVTKGPVPDRPECFGVVPPANCGTIAGEGYWVVKFDSSGSPAIVGELSTPNDQFVVSVGDNNVSTPVDEYRVVDGWLEYGPGDGCDVMPRPTSGVVCLDSHLTAMPGATAFWEIVQTGAYRTFGSTDVSAGPIHGIWLVHVCTTCGRDEILARLETVTW